MVETEFPSKQARLLFAYLVCERARLVPREELADLLWQDAMPRAWDSALKSLISKLRQSLAGLEDASVTPLILSRFGCYQLRLPPNTWIDLEVASHCIDEAEGALRSGRVELAWGPTNVALVITKRPFLPGEDQPEPCFAHAGVADEGDLGVGVLNGWNGGFATKQHFKVQVPDADDGVLFAERCEDRR